MDAVGADQEVRFHCRTVLESRDHPLTLLLQPYELVADMQTLLRQRVGQKIYKIRAVEVVVRRAEGRLDLGSEWSALQGASIVPAPLMHRAWPRADGVHRSPEAQPQQEPRGVGADLDACADFGDVRRLLIDVDVEPHLQELQRRREPADPAADHCDFHGNSFGPRVQSSNLSIRVGHRGLYLRQVDFTTLFIRQTSADTITGARAATKLECGILQFHFPCEGRITVVVKA